MNYIKLLTLALTVFFMNGLSAQDFDLRTTQSGQDIVVEIIYTGGGAAPTTGDFLLDLNFELQSTDETMTFGAINNTAGWGVNTQGAQTVEGGFARRTFGLSNAPINFPVDLSDATYTEIARITTDAAAGSVISVGAAGTHPTNPGIPFLNVNGADFTPSTTGGAALPLDLITFNVTKHDALSSLLTWTTEMEQDFSHFNVQRSLDGTNWRPIADVKGSRINTVQINSYELIDNEIPFLTSEETTVYYRLKMIDLNGKFEYSDIKSIDFENRNDIVNVYPNPTVDFINVTADTEVNDVIIYNIDGKIVLQQKYSGKIDISSYDAGLYKVIIKTQSGSTTKTIVKLD